MFLLRTVLNSAILWYLPGSALSPFLNKFTTTPSLHLLGAYSFFHIYPIIQHNHHGEHTFFPVLLKFMHYFICPRFLSTFSRLATHFFTYFSSRELSLWLIRTTDFPFWRTYVRLCPRVDFRLEFRVESFRWLWAFLACGKL